MTDGLAREEALLEVLRCRAPRWDDAVRVVSVKRDIGEPAQRHQVIILESGRAVRGCACGYREVVEAVPGKNVVHSTCPRKGCGMPLEWVLAMREKEPKVRLYVPERSGGRSFVGLNLEAEFWWLTFSRWAWLYRTTSVPHPEILVELWAASFGVEELGRPASWRCIAVALARELRLQQVPHPQSVLHVWNRLRDGYEA